jgi:hypothetical protein
VRSAEQGCGLGHGSGRQQLPDPGRRHRLSSGAGAEEAEAGDVEAILGAHVLEEGHVASPLIAEMEVVPDDHGPGIEAADQDLPHEVLCGLVGAIPIETDHERIVDARVFEKLQALFEVGQETWRRFGPHDRGRMTVESYDRRGQILLGGNPSYPLDEQPMPDVDAVVSPDRHRAGAPRHAVAGIVEHLHHGEGYGAFSGSVEPAPSAQVTGT